MDYIMQYISEIVCLGLGLVGGSFITLHFKNNTASGNARIVNQRGTKAGGDVVGGNKITGTSRKNR